MDEAHPVLQELRAEYGANVAALVVEKKKEVGLVCGSPHRCFEQCRGRLAVRREA